MLATFFLGPQPFGPPKMSLVLRPPVAWSLILRTGPDKIVTATRFVSVYEILLNAMLLTVLGVIVHYVYPNDVSGKHVRQTTQSTL